MVNTATATIEYSELPELPSVARKIIDFAGDEKVWIFEGEMGAGKTTLIRALCDSFEVEDNVTSPTFSLVNEYHAAGGQVIYHFDFYRIKNEAEAMDIGVEEYLYSGDYCFIEWPSRIHSLLPSSYLKVQITVRGQVRYIELFKNTKQE